ncbi:MAG: hypothetical protein WC213_02900 [Arenimonas sp.]|jgi:hypothetical protein
MINPSSAAILPIASGATPQRGKDQAGAEDFSAWLDLALTPVAPIEVRPDDQSGRNFLLALQTQEAPHPMLVLQPLSASTVELALASGTEANLGALAAAELLEPNSELPVAPAAASAVAAAPVPAPAPAPDLASMRADPSAAPAATTQALAATTLDRASVNAGGERVDFVTVLWHLQANAGLSYRSADGDALQFIGDRFAHLPVMPMNASGPGVGQGRMSTPPLAIEDRQPLALQRLAVLAQLRDARREEASAGGLDAAAQRAGWAPLLTWPQRVLRWLGDGEGTTAWVRDYQMDLSKVQTLLDSLRCLAEQQGLPLRRVMLNGHELWRSPSTP